MKMQIWGTNSYTKLVSKLSVVLYVINEIKCLVLICSVHMVNENMLLCRDNGKCSVDKQTKRHVSARCDI